MAFVYRNQTSSPSALSTPGPGNYQSTAINPSAPIKKDTNNTPSVAKQSDEIRSAAPFNKSEERKLWKNNQSPGPGQYHVAGSLVKQKTLITKGQVTKMMAGNVNASAVLYQQPVQTSQFKSSSSRFGFIGRMDRSPGPGSYQVDNDGCVKSYIKNDDRMRFKKMYPQPMPTRKPTLQQSIHFQRPRFLSNEKEHGQTSPGKNDSGRNIALIRSQLLGIATKYGIGHTTGDIDYANRQGALEYPSTRQGTTNKLNRSSSAMPHKQRRVNTREIIAEPVEEAELGPGAYQVGGTIVKKPVGSSIQCFGSTSRRFDDRANFMSSSTGHSSEYQTNMRRQPEVQKSANFASITGRDDIARQNSHSPGPGSYQPKNDFTNILRDKCKRGGKDTFGSSQERFVDNMVDSVMENQQTQRIVYQRVQSQAVFKRKDLITTQRKQMEAKRLLAQQAIGSNFGQISSHSSLNMSVSTKFDDSIHLKKHVSHRRPQKSSLATSQRLLKREDDVAQPFETTRIKRILKTADGHSNDQLGSKTKGYSMPRAEKGGWLVRDIGDSRQPTPFTYNPTKLGSKEFNVLFLK